MAQFEATVRVFEVNEVDPIAARRAVEERLRSGGFARFQIMNLGVQGAIPARIEPPATRRRRVGMQASYAGGGMLVAAVVAWTLWFLWMLAG
ncbi:MAG TPA: hypothetical protein VMT89_16045 [Candidatus Acidoferrales bacterium]|nr:hypothetical protein [Candidatus Acidoferrales bacterium]